MRRGSPDCGQALDEARGWVDYLEARAASGRGLVAPHPSFPDAWTDLQASLAGLRGALDAVQADPSLASDVEHSAGLVTQAVARLRELAAEMPRLHDLPLVHEILVLGLQQLQGRGEYHGELEERLRPLAEVPGAEETAGGLYLYLHVTGDPADLSNALSLLERLSVEVPVGSESEQPALNAWLAGDSSALVRVQQWLRGLAADVVLLEQGAFLPLSMRRQYLPQLVSLLDRMDSALAANDAAGFHALAVEFDAVQADVEDLLAGRPSLGPRFDALVALMEGAWSGSATDAALEEALLEVVEAQEGFRRAPAGFRELLEAQRDALRYAFRYLETGEPGLLLQAYEDLVVPTLRMAALEEAETLPVTCVFCGGVALRGATRCGRCGRPLPVAPVEDEPARASSENFQRLAELLDDAAAGTVTPAEAQDRLLPLWDAVLQVEARAADPVLAADRVRDPALAARQEELQELVASLRDVLAEIFEALDAGALEALGGLRARALAVGEALAQFHAALSG